GVGTLPGLRPVVGDDPDELIRSVHRPGAQDAKPELLAQGDDPGPPLRDPLTHLARLDGVLAQLPGHAFDVPRPGDLEGAPPARNPTLLLEARPGRLICRPEHVDRVVVREGDVRAALRVEVLHDEIKQVSVRAW